MLLTAILEFFNQHLLPNHIFSWAETGWMSSGTMFDSELSKIIPFTHQTWPCTKQQFWNSSTTIIFLTIYTLEQKLLWKASWNMETKKKLRSFHLHIKDCLALNNHFWFLQTLSSFKPYILLRRNLMGGSRRICYTEKPKSFHWDVKEGPAINSHHETLQATSSKPYVFLAQTWRETSGKINSEWLEQFFSDIKEVHAHEILQTRYFVDYMFLTVPLVVRDCGHSWSYPLVFCPSSPGQWNRWAV